jgi:hypothetical protein
MPLSLSSFCPLLGISTGVLCAKTKIGENHVVRFYQDRKDFKKPLKVLHFKAGYNY